MDRHPLRELRRFLSTIGQNMKFGDMGSKNFRFMQSIRTSTDDADTLLAVEECIADGTVAYPLAFQFRNAGNLHALPRSPCRKDYTGCRKLEIFARHSVAVKCIIEAELHDLAALQRDAEATRSLDATAFQFCASYRFRKAIIVFNAFRLGKRALPFCDYRHGGTAATRVKRSRYACRTRANHDDFLFHFAHPPLLHNITEGNHLSPLA